METKNILVIDDDKTNVQQIGEMLRMEGFTVYTASSKAEAVELALKTLPALVFVKSMLMDASGYEIIRDIRSEDAVKNTQFIVLTEIEKTYDDRYRSIYKIVDSIKLPVDKRELITKASKYVELDSVVESTEGTAQFPDDEGEIVGSIALNDQGGFDDNVRLRFDKDEDTVKITGDTFRESLSKEKDHYEESSKTSQQFEEDMEPAKRPSPEKLDTHKELEDTVHIRDMKDDEESMEEKEPPAGLDITAIDADDAEEYLQKLNEDRAKKKKIIMIGVSAAFVLILVSVFVFSRGGKVAQKKQDVVSVTDTTVIDKAVEEPQETPESAPALERKHTTPKPTPVVEHKPAPEPAPAKKTVTAEKHQVKPAPVQQKALSGGERVSAKAEATPRPEQHAATEQTQKPAATPVKPKAEKTGKTEAAEGVYSIQVGSFKDQNNAKKFVENLKKEGYSAFIKEGTGKDSPWHKVYVGKYKKKEDAAAVVNKLKSGGKLEVLLKKI
ncbi:MAG: SPOR domain-containing protein [Nitrospirae bacterium YQR-1]